MSTPEPLALAMALTRAMLEAARAGDWEQVLALEDQRHPLVKQPLAGDEDGVRQLGELLTLDRELQALVVQARDAAARRWQAAHDGVRAVAAYGG
ncbi:MAG TPA: flagellar protein FliT [Frateuria sp.]|uniref:flagellar protein FliT n=1 Tax=Frateuria sp. TaxID=2211372 RepID=UPI002DE27774|nr:flagellar protein FliT [Frateuria sp.]